MSNRTTVANGLLVEQIGDIPLIIKSLQKIKLGEIIDNAITVHKNWEGLSIGKLAEIWMSYIITEGDHRLNKLEDWAMERILLFETLYDGQSLRRTDFTDDKLAKVLDYLSVKEHWLQIEPEINSKIFRVYHLLNGVEGMLPIRLDATIGQGHRSVKEGGLFQFGASKHFNASLPQFKIMMSTVDSQINGFAYPVASMTVSGNTADDVLYVPILEQTKKSIGSTDGLLVVGDKKLGSTGNRAHIVQSGNYYLSPLSEVQLSSEELKPLIQENEGLIKNVFLNKKKAGMGFEYGVQMSVPIESQESTGPLEWEERRIVFQSTGHAKSQVKAFENRIVKAQEKLENLLIKKQRKQTLETEDEIRLAVSHILKHSRLEAFIDVEILKTTETKTVRGYKGKPSRKEKIEKFELLIKSNSEKIDEHKSYCGWCTYATNAPSNKMKLRDVVCMYRGQYQIETRFNDLKNKVTNLMPVFLHKENRVRGLINFMMIGLKAICSIEIKAAVQLKKGNKELQGIYSGNPKRGTAKPTAKMMLGRFKGVAISLFMENGKPKFMGLTPLNPVQLKILRLLGFKSDIYTDIIKKLESKFLT